jgi:EAL domain-containing protein (putative c-di-GMP-specific phosphodiesterase class I)
MELAALDCDGAQGYHISTPKPASELGADLSA